MNDQTHLFTQTTNQVERPLRRRHVSFNVLPIREEPTPAQTSPTPILVDYSSIRERKQLNLSDFLHSDNPVTFFLFTFWRAICFFCKIFILPFIIIKYLYLLMLRVYGIRRPTTSITTSDLFSVSSSQSSSTTTTTATSSSSSPQQRPIVWILTLIDYIIYQITSLPDLIRHIISSIRKHIEGTVSKSFNLIDTCTSHQLTKTYSMFRRIFFDKNTDLKMQTQR